MLDKAIIDAIYYAFNEKFGDLSEKDKYIKTTQDDFFKLIDCNLIITKEIRGNIEDALSDVVSAASVLGYFIGLGDGAYMSGFFQRPDVAEQMLKASDDWLE